MAAFDIIDASGRAYMLAWKERQYLLRLAAIPLLIKIICVAAVEALGFNERFLVAALIMLPSYFADGWMVSHLVRLIYFGQRWPFRPSGDVAADTEQLRARAHGILAGTLTYVVIKFLMQGFVAVTFVMIAQAQLQQDSPTLGMALGSLGFLVFTLWAFRFVWLPIPAALDYSLKDFVKTMRGFKTSLILIATWMICFLPIFTLLRVVAGVILAPYATPELVPLSAQLLTTFLTLLMDTAEALIASAGIAYGVREWMFKTSRKV